MNNVLSLPATGGETRVVRVSNAVAVPRDFAKQIDGGPKIIVMAGELGKRKGADILIAAWEKVAPEMPGWRLQMVGPKGGDVHDWPEIDGLDYCPPEPRQQLIERLQHAQFAILPTRNEALPMFIIEAMANGCPVISTPVGQISDLVSDQTGVLVPVGDIEATAHAIWELASNEQLRKRLSRNARNLIAHRYSEDAIKPILEDEWIRLANRKAAV
ncbi:glycosyltransferase [Rhodococcus hoagii]|nr:glycosyltransferase [Prescottella equi]